MTDLTEAVEAAARAHVERLPHAIAWQDLTPLVQHDVRQDFAPIVAAVAPLIEAETKRAYAEELVRRLQAPMVDFDVNSWDRPMKGER